MRAHRTTRTVLLGTIFSLVPARAFAHLVNTDVGEFYAGMMHPLTSLEHLLPILALALLASQCGKQAGRWALAVFPLALMAGIILGRGLSAPPVFLRFGSLALLPILGILLACAPRIPAAGVAGAALVTGLLLGCRSGIDMAASKVGYQFIPGVALTGLIVIAVFSGWVPQFSLKRARTLRIVLGGGFAAAGLAMLAGTFGPGMQAFRGVGLPGQADLLAIVKAKELSPPIILGAFMAASIWGAAHALTPGHGKAIVGAYLVGARSTPWHAVYLGLTVTLTHTFGVFLLGLVALFASSYVLPEQLYPWLGAASGLIVLVLGATMFVNRIRPLLPGGVQHPVHSHHHHHHHDGQDPDSHHRAHHHGHDEAHSNQPHQDDPGSGHVHPHVDEGHGHEYHGHAHLPPGTDGAPVTWRSLLGLGISGGLLPCPGALVLLLTAISLGRAGFGMGLVAAFSLGLAIVLTTVGLLFVKGGRLVQGAPRVPAFSRFLPAASAIVIFTIGAVITAEAVLQIVN